VACGGPDNDRSPRDGVFMAMVDRTPDHESHAVWRWRPGFASFLVAFCFSLLLTTSLRLLDPRTGPMSWYASVVWTLPLVLTAQGIVGGLYARRMMTRGLETAYPDELMSSEQMVVVVPTIARQDTYAALTRVLNSLCTYLPRHFTSLRVDVVIEEDCDTRNELLNLVAANPRLRVLTVPRDFRTPRGTRFKARAIHYAHLLRQREGEARGDVWILHMDDDTGVNSHTGAELARFVECQRVAGDEAKHLAQGILAYPREYSRSRITWYADAVRPGCDISFFPITTGRGKPRVGLHGELLLVRASIEAEIGWDFGPHTIVEDAEFAMRFCDTHPGRSAWFPACSYGASPASLADFIKQRERWVWGLLRLLTQSSIPMRRRIVLLPTIAVWVGAPIANPIALITIGFLLGDADTSPVNLLIGFAWAINFGFYIWLYWEGFKINLYWSAESRRQWWEPLAIVAGTPVFAVMECLGIASGLARFIRGTEMRFTVIEKPA
jgi:glycosyl transferase family 2